MLKFREDVDELLKVCAWEVALGSSRRRELAPLHVSQFFAAMVVRAKGHQLRDVSFRSSTQQRLGDIKYTDWLVLTELNLLIEYSANSDNPPSFIKWEC